MEANQIKLNIRNFRAVKNATIVLNGITVIAGENGSGKSTISKLAYHLFKISKDYDDIVDKKADLEINKIQNRLTQLVMDLSYILKREEYIKIRQLFRQPLRSQTQLDIFDEDDSIFSRIDLLINALESHSFSLETFPNSKNQIIIGNRINRLKLLLKDTLQEKELPNDIDFNTLLLLLKDKVKEIINKAEAIKENRPLEILNDSLIEVFNEHVPFRRFDLEENGVSIIDRKNNKLLPVYSIESVAYIDTPMVLGIDTLPERVHWEHLNSILQNKGKKRKDFALDQIFEKEIIKGEAKFSDEAPYEHYKFKYIREDGSEFDLLECATGLKSFAILQMLYKNGYLCNKSLLIIDEPEVHLHPQWVVEYARLIVLLNKIVGVKFLIASHHPDMISAIKYISEKEKVDNNLNFYLSEKKTKDFVYEYKSLRTDIEKIFTSFNIAFERIDLYGGKAE